MTGVLPVAVAILWAMRWIPSLYLRMISWTLSLSSSVAASWR